MRRTLILAILTVACSDSAESPRHSAEVVVPAGPLTVVTNDLGWVVETTKAEVSFRDLEFTTHGEEHASLLPSWLVGTAYAHPGHLADGDVIGALDGSWTVDFAAGGATLGTAEMIAGKYEGLNFRFSGSMRLEGTATKEGDVVNWTADVAQDDGRRVTGVIFDRQISGDGESLSFTFQPVDTTTGVTIYDDVDFAAGSAFEADSPTSIRLSRAAQRHDFWMCR